MDWANTAATGCTAQDGSTDQCERTWSTRLCRPAISVSKSSAASDGASLCACSSRSMVNTKRSGAHQLGGSMWWVVGGESPGIGLQ